MTIDNLQVRKKQLVRNVIVEAAIDLFSVNGFDETTVEEVARAAGVSRRSFFRYFASKDDLLAENVVHYGEALTAAITAYPATATSLEIVRETVGSVAKHSVEHPRTRQVIEIAERSPSARQAHLSRLIQVEDSVKVAFAKRLRSGTKDELKPRLLASLTLSILNVAIVSWYRGEYHDISTATNEVFSNLTHILCGQTKPSQAKKNMVSGRKPSVPTRRRTSRS